MNYSTDFAISRRIIAEALAAYRAGNINTAWVIAKTDPLLNANTSKAAWLEWASRKI